MFASATVDPARASVTPRSTPNSIAARIRPRMSITRTPTATASPTFVIVAPVQ